MLSYVTSSPFTDDKIRYLSFKVSQRLSMILPNNAIQYKLDDIIQYGHQDLTTFSGQQCSHNYVIGDL